jgi:hypothetical protein
MSLASYVLCTVCWVKCIMYLKSTLFHVQCWVVKVLDWLGDVVYTVSKGGGLEVYGWTLRPDAEFLDVIGTKVWRVFFCAIHSHLYLRIFLWELTRLCPETSTKLNVHEFRFGKQSELQWEAMVLSSNSEGSVLRFEAWKSLFVNRDMGVYRSDL